MSQSHESQPCQPRVVVVAPTYDNASTLRPLLDALAAQGLDVIVVDDGSTDSTSDVLAEWTAEDATRIAIRHDTNQGKAAAMRTGFERAAALGHTHALTIDTDGQHDPADVPSMIEAMRANPPAIVVGARPMSGDHYPLRSRLGRTLSNALVWIIGGVWVDDSQCGLRVYPLDVVRLLGAKTSRYAFETEVLARAGWAAVPVVEVPIRCIYDVPGGRVTHFKLWRDSVSAVWMHAGLLHRTVWPVPPRKLGPVDDRTTSGTLVERSIRWMNPLRTWRLIRVDAAERERVAASMGVGIFIGIQPAFGLKTILCLVLSKLLRLQPLITMGTSSLTTPPVGLFFWAASIAVGQLLLHGRWTGWHGYDFAAVGAAAVFKAVALEWVVGALVLGGAVGLSTWAITRFSIRRLARSPVPAPAPQLASAKAPA